MTSDSFFNIVCNVESGHVYHTDVLLDSNLSSQRRVYSYMYELTLEFPEEIIFIKAV